MLWREAKSLDTLISQVNEEFPNRDRSSDGTIGDLAHSQRVSDHNPNKHGVVQARDIDEDLVPGGTDPNGFSAAMRKLVDSICHSRDRRVKYIIYEGRITVKGSALQAWKAYTGPNAHKHHCHISVVDDPALYDDTTPWKISEAPVAEVHVDEATPASARPEFYIVRKGDTFWGIARKFATSVQTLKYINNTSSDVLLIGQRIQVK